MGIYSPKNVLEKEPAVVSGAVVAVVNALVLLNVVTLGAEQLAGANVAMVAVLSLLVRQSVTPNAKL